MPETETLQAEGRPAPGAPIFANILCAISGNEGGFAAVEHAAALAGPQGHLTFLMVTSFRSGGAHRGAAIGPTRGAEILQRAEGIAREAGVPYTSEVDPGTPPARVILDWSAGYDLLAIGAPASSWPAKLLSVGVGDKALGGFSTALLVGRPLAGGRRFGDRIVVASDGLDASRGLIRLASGLAGVPGSSVRLVHALGRELPIKRSRASEQESALQEQEQMHASSWPSGSTELVVKSGRAGPVIVSAATAADASVVAMGSRRL